MTSPPWGGHHPHLEGLQGSGCGRGSHQLVFSEEPHVAKSCGRVRSQETREVRRGLRGTSYLFCAAVLDLRGIQRRGLVLLPAVVSVCWQCTKLCVYTGRACARVS